MTPATSVEEYLEACPTDARAMLERIREIALEAAPGAVDTISYQMPALRFENRVLVWYAAFARHVSLFPASDAVIRGVGPTLEPYIAGRGTIRFAREKPLPEELVRRIVDARISEIRARGAASRSGPDALRRPAASPPTRPSRRSCP
jgi:uncharacterized protein YdhG (YjbR/CyaY superfamily)